MLPRITNLHIIISLILLILIAGCGKDTDHTAIINNNSLTAREAKEWYYGVFKKSTEWGQSTEKGKKLPDWKNGVYKKIGNIEIIEFPLIKQKTFIAVDSVGRTKRQMLEIAKNSLSRLSFIKTNGQIFVREMNYVPDYQYLQDKNWDISSVSIHSTNSDFTGKLYIKKWNGENLSVNKIKKGRLASSGKVYPQSGLTKFLESRMTCTWSMTPIMVEECDFEIELDDPELRTCEMVESGDYILEIYCEDEPADPQDPEYPGETGCEFDVAPNCVCELYMLDCSDPSPGDPGGNEPPVTIVVDLVDDDCLEKVLAQMNSNTETFFYGLTNMIFGNSESLHVTLFDYYDNSSDAPLGYANGVIGGSTFQIGINTFHSQGSSEEDIAGTFLHEMIHAYLMSHPTVWNVNDPQHLYMMTNMLETMANDLVLLFPNLDYKDALAVSYNGLTYDEDPLNSIFLTIVRNVLNTKLQNTYPGTSIQDMEDLGKSYQKGGNKGTRSTICQ